jgi:hypothetical protein
MYAAESQKIACTQNHVPFNFAQMTYFRSKNARGIQKTKLDLLFGLLKLRIVEQLNKAENFLHQKFIVLNR